MDSDVIGALAQLLDEAKKGMLSMKLAAEAEAQVIWLLGNISTQFLKVRHCKALSNMNARLDKLAEYNGRTRTRHFSSEMTSQNELKSLKSTSDAWTKQQEAEQARRGIIFFKGSTLSDQSVGVQLLWQEPPSTLLGQ